MEAIRHITEAALDFRVLLHQERAARRLSVPDYLAGLRAVREVERELEPLRGAEHSRAFELAVTAVRTGGAWT